MYYNLFGLSCFQEIILSSSPNLAEVKKDNPLKIRSKNPIFFLKINTI